LGYLYSKLPEEKIKMRMDNFKTQARHIDRIKKIFLNKGYGANGISGDLEKLPGIQAIGPIRFLRGRNPFSLKRVFA